MRQATLRAFVLVIIGALLLALVGGLPATPAAISAGPTPEVEHGAEHHEQHEHEHGTVPGDEGDGIDVVPQIEPVTLADGSKLKVAATTSTVGHVVDQVGGEAIELTRLMEPGEDSHTYHPAPRDVAAMNDADMIFINGAGLEAFMHDIIDTLDEGAVIVPVSAGIELIPGHHGHEEEHEHEGEHADEPVAEHEGHGEHEGHADHEAHEEHEAHEGHHHVHEWDPHTWTSPANVMVWVENIEGALSAADPANSDLYAANSEAYRATLEELDEWAMEAVDQLPPEKRKIVTSHEAWNYFARHYGFEQIGAVIPAVSTSSEPAAGEFAEMVRTLEDQGVDVVFVDYEVNPKLSETMANEIGAGIARIWHELSPEGEGADTYENWLRFNVNQFVENLQ